MSLRTKTLLSSLLLLITACSDPNGDGPGGPGGMGQDDMPPAQVTLGSTEAVRDNFARALVEMGEGIQDANFMVFAPPPLPWAC